MKACVFIPPKNIAIYIYIYTHTQDDLMRNRPLLQYTLDRICTYVLDETPLMSCAGVRRPQAIQLDAMTSRQAQAAGHGLQNLKGSLTHPRGSGRTPWKPTGDRFPGVKGHHALNILMSFLARVNWVRVAWELEKNTSVTTAGNVHGSTGNPPRP